MTQKKAILLVNVGTPDAPEKDAVKKYLTGFLNDKYVIDLPWLLRKILVNLIIIPSRVNRSTSLYRQLWTDRGSPLLYNMNSIIKKLSALAGEKYLFKGAMRYGSPSLDNAINEIKEAGIEEMIVLPLYPHYTFSTTETLKNYLLMRDDLDKIRISIVDQFYNHHAYINAFIAKIKSFDYTGYDHIIFSYHGLPLRHIRKVHPQINPLECNCEKEMPVHGRMCYRAACYDTTRQMAARLCLDERMYSTSFQSRLSRNWMEPFTDEIIRQRALMGDKKIMVVAPSFVSDCLETTIEIGVEYNELFGEMGGDRLDLVESLNDSDEWIGSIIEIIGSAVPLVLTQFGSNY